MRRPSPHVSEVLDEYLVVRKGMGRSENTLRNDKVILHRFASRVAGGRDPEMGRITVKHVQDYLYGPKSEMWDRRPGTHNNHLTKIRGLFEFAQSRGYCREQLITPYNGFSVKKDPIRERFRPSPALLMEMLNSAVDPSHRAYLALSINTLGRSGEITALRIGNLDLEAGWITYTVFKTKQQDTFPISSDLKEELLRWLPIYAKELGRPLHDDDFLIPARSARRVVGKMVRKDNRHVPVMVCTYQPDRQMTHPHRIVQKALRDCGRDSVLGEGTHTVRRAMARAMFDDLAARDGMEGALEIVSALLHHASVTMTERYLGVEARRMKRDSVVKGQPLLSAMVKDPAEVVRLHA